MATITDAGLTIAEAAARAGVSGDTLRYYERVSLVAPIERNGSDDGTEAQRLALLEAHREDVRERLAEVSSTLELIDYKIGFYRERVDGGDDLRC
jgi:DNA-binding transcriptional MerR regulator